MKPRPRQRGRLASLLFVLTILLGLYTLGVYALSYTLWVKHWLAGFLMLSLPVAMAGLVLAFVYWLVVWPARAWFPLVVLGLGWPFWQRTLSWHTPTESLRPATTLKVLNYNLRYFDGDLGGAGLNQEAPRFVDWVVEFDADVKMFQEFYNRDESAQFRVTQRLERAGYPHHIFLKMPGTLRPNQGNIGLAIFSRYPLLLRHREAYSANGNGYLVADLVRGHDTVRLVNVQFYSMGIRVGRVLRQRSLDGAEAETRGVARQLKKGFQRRIPQIAQVERLVLNSPHPVILAGDLNETPYGLAYGILRRHLRNAFEEVGRGFGFTYNRQPKFIRIDNQFFGDGKKAAGKKLTVRQFTTHSSIRFSDHNPISAEYVLSK